ncbi:periplasmic chaperone for outer membrane proteins SurA [Succinivibrio dextrinosolvens]|uniref:peptidylprolyl isomerase n=1 Tax=Succinivibrio dextrinosolvens TaxID=83771 RepID=UPI0008E37605|nr:peptidylprolyl isomerase [Succinivibrio dextrinosolvens]SFS77455.1 periplasmic chaperone for outer membrane proteins SurA [Succinivibrio dextrinosolvens]
MRIKQTFTKLSLIAMLGASFAIAPTLAHAEEEVALDSTAAVVNGGIILESELNRHTRDLMQNYKAHGAQVDELTARRQALQSLITRSLILQLAQSNGADIPDMQLDSILKQAALRNNTTTEKILASYGNIPEAQARQKFKEDYILNEVRRSSVRQRINISDSEINTYAKALKERGSVEPMYHLGQVVVPLSSNPTEQEYRRAQANAQKALKEVRSGANIEEVAAKYAVGSESADLGYLPETAIPLPFLPAIVNAKPGAVVGPFRSSVGLHILKLYDVTKNAITPIKTYKASHILIKTSIIFSDEAAIAKLNSIMDDVKAGKLTFADAAKKYSEDPGSAVHGGDLGYQSLDAYDPGFAAGIAALSVGQYSEPVKSSYGWHIIHLEDVKIDKDSLEAYKDKAASIIFEREYAEAVAYWERGLRESAYIHVIDPELVRAGAGIEMENTSVGQPQQNKDGKISQGSVYMN